MNRYCDEFSFRWDHRRISDSDRTETALRQANGKRWPTSVLSNRINRAPSKLLPELSVQEKVQLTSRSAARRVCAPCEAAQCAHEIRISLSATARMPPAKEAKGGGILQTSLALA